MNGTNPPFGDGDLTTEDLRTRPVTWSLVDDQGIAGSPGETVLLKLRAAMAPKVRLYTDRTYTGLEFSPVPTTVSIGPEKIIAGVGKMTAGGETIRKVDSHFGDQELEYWVGTVTIDVPVTIAATATANNTYNGSVSIEYMSCNDKVCYPPKTVTLPVSINVTR